MMMISPEEYRDCFLTGKSAEQIETEIRKLQREIRKLERIVGRPGYQPAICPSEDVQLICNREYLAQARLTLEAARTAEEKEA